MLRILKKAGVRLTVVYHDVEPFAGTRMIDRLRRQVQLRAMRHAMGVCDVAVFTVPMEKLSWIKPEYTHAVFIPVGANLPAAGGSVSRKSGAIDGKLNIAVFSVTGGRSTEGEIREIVEAVRFAASRVKDLERPLKFKC